MSTSRLFLCLSRLWRCSHLVPCSSVGPDRPNYLGVFPAMSPDAESVSSSSSPSSSDESPVAAPPASSVGSLGGALRVSYDCRKCRQCTLCNAKSTDESPLDYSEEIFPEVQGRIPWRSYEKVKTDDGETVRVPSGRLCLICFNVYRALSFLAACLSSRLWRCFLFL